MALISHISSRVGQVFRFLLHGDTLTSAAIAGDTVERSLANHDLKHAVPAVSIASVFSALKIMLAVFAEGG